MYLLMTEYVVAQCSPSKGSPPLTSQFNTGNDGNGGTIPSGNQDLNWTIAIDSINGSYQPAYVMNNIPSSYYRSTWPDCEWISFSPDGRHNDSIDLFYKITFNLPCKDLCERSYDRSGTLCLKLDFYVDNAVEEIYVNGIPQSARINSVPTNNPYWHNGFGSGRMVSVSLCHDWKGGSNTMIVHIKSAYCCTGFLAQESVNSNSNSSPFDSSLLNDTIDRTICEGRSFFFGTKELSKTGTYKETFKPRPGCDSVVVLRLNVTPAIVTSQSDTVCKGGSVQGHTLSGNYRDTFTTYLGCDSIHVLKLHVKDKDTFIIDKTICKGQTYQFGSQALTSSGTYSHTLVSFQGCVYIETLELKVESSTFLYMYDTICEGGNSQGHSTAGVHNDTLINSNGCDSIRTLQLYVRNKTFTAVFDTICPGTSFQGYATKGIYRDTFMAFNGCDSIRTLHLELYPPLPEADFSYIQDACTGKTGFVNKSLNYDHSAILWELDKTSYTMININHTFSTKGSYSVKLIIKNPNGGCADTAEKLVVIDYINTAIRVPNVFTPGNDDSLNKNYMIEGLRTECGDKADIQIYNRWGLLIFEGDISKTSWNGKLHNTGNDLPSGTYYYLMILKRGDEKAVMCNGVIYLVR